MQPPYWDVCTKREDGPDTILETVAENCSEEYAELIVASVNRAPALRESLAELSTRLEKSVAQINQLCGMVNSYAGQLGLGRKVNAEDWTEEARASLSNFAGHGIAAILPDAEQQGNKGSNPRLAQDHEAKWKRAYLDLADAVCRESTGPEDACRQARETRAKAAALEASVCELRSALGVVVKMTEDGDLTTVELDEARTALANAKARSLTT